MKCHSLFNFGHSDCSVALLQTILHHIYCWCAFQSKDQFPEGAICMCARHFVPYQEAGKIADAVRIHPEEQHSFFSSIFQRLCQGSRPKRSLWDNSGTARLSGGATLMIAGITQMIVSDGFCGRTDVTAWNMSAECIKGLSIHKLSNTKWLKTKRNPKQKYITRKTENVDSSRWQSDTIKRDKGL